MDDREKQGMMVERVREEYDVVLDIPLLMDLDHGVIDRYGLFNANERRGRPVPHPTTYVIDRDGIVRWKMTEVNYRIRPTNEAILEALSALR